MGVEAVYVGAAPGYRLEETAQAGKTAGTGAAAEKTETSAEAAVSVEHKDAAGRGGWVDRVLEEVKREFSGLPVYVGVEEGYVYVKRTAPMDRRQFRKYLKTCRRLGFRFDRRGRGGLSRWRS